MAWWPPKTWTFQEVLSYADLNKYVRDNLQYLYDGVQKVASQTIRTQTAQVTLSTGGAWNTVDSGGLGNVAVGEVLSGDFLEISAGAAITATGGGTLGVAVYDGTTLLARYVGTKTATTGDSAVIHVAHPFTVGYSSIIVYMIVKPAAAGSLPAPSGTDKTGWLSVTYKKPPV
jgi:hypothetical protein